jgi:hypothetical protein
MLLLLLLLLLQHDSSACCSSTGLPGLLHTAMSSVRCILEISKGQTIMFNEYFYLLFDTISC